MSKDNTVSLKSYNPGNKVIKKSLFKRSLWYITNSLFLRSYLLPVSRFKSFLLRVFGASIGKGVVIKPGVNIKYPWLLEVGDYVWIGEGVWIDNLCVVKIDNNVCISQGALLLTGNHNYKRSTFDLITGPITLEEGVWIGANSVVCPGVTCFSHSILTVGSVAVSDMEPYYIYQGNPASKIREREISESE
jgi:putative colanic acid biosynthesis acetyltransferase WcaF